MTAFDIVIIGGGPAGLTASVYALRAGKSTALIEKGMLGGQVLLTYEVKNYPAFENITGFELADKMSKHALNNGLKVLNGEVLKISKKGKNFTIKYTNGEISAKKVILCMGASARHLNVVGESEFTGKGVSYCATCDGNLFKGLDVAVVGGGDTAFEDIKYLAKLANKVYAIHRSTNYKANQELQDEVLELVKTDKVVMMPNTIVRGIKGDRFVTQIDTYNTQTDESSTLDVRGVFVAIGSEPRSAVVKDLVSLDDYGYIKVDTKRQTSVKGIYSAGDITTTGLRQIITACADGAIAGSEAAKSINAVDKT
ncbi:MAG: NAD(P)/FAD-dependent oxidoreductase [Clostridia bacterium]